MNAGSKNDLSLAGLVAAANRYVRMNVAAECERQIVAEISKTLRERQTPEDSAQDGDDGRAENLRAPIV